jgi:hypothetical protein
VLLLFLHERMEVEQGERETEMHDCHCMHLFRGEIYWSHGN